MKKILVWVLVVVGACNILSMMVSCGQKKIATDGYYFEKETFTRTDLGVTIVLVKNQEEMSKLLEEHGKTVAQGNEVAAFSTLSEKEPKCTIYMIDPKTNYQPEFIGHELVHCVYGNWHTIQP
jgi:hypothetical protein